MACFIGFRPFSNKGNILNGVQNSFFKDGTPGVHYLPDPGVVYGASGLATFGEGVSAVLDEKNGTPVLGPELVTNGTFDTDTAWAKGTDWTISGGTASRSASSAGSSLSQSVALIAGRTYQVSYTLSAVSNQFLARFTGGTTVAGATRTSAGTYTEFIVAASGNNTLELRSPFATSTATIDNISVRELPGNHARQASASLRPLLGRASRRGRVNLYSDTERGIAANNLFGINAAGSGSIISAIPGPDGDFAADLITLTNATDFHMIRRGNVGSSGQTLSFTARLKPAGYWKYAIADVYGGYNKYAAFDLQSKTVIYNQSLVGAPYIEELDDGWFRIGITAATAPVLALSLIVLPPDYVAPASAQSALFQWQADGVSGFYFGGLQAELGGVTAHQRVSANLADISDPGIRSDQFVRFDLSDDRLDTVLPQAVTGDVVIAGRNGSVIAPHSYAANTTFQLGPTSYTGGTPGILRAVGDVVGYTIVGRNITYKEQVQLMDFYKWRGAKGLLVPGPELITNGGLDGAANWTTSNVTIANGVAQFGRGVEGSLMQTISLVAGKFYQFELTVAGTTGTSARVRFGGSTSTSFINYTGNGAFKGVIQAVSGNTRIEIFSVTSTFNGTVDNVSVKEIRPEEEW